MLARILQWPAFIDGHRGKLVILDEAQRIASLFATLRRHRSPEASGHERGQFLIA